MKHIQIGIYYYYTYTYYILRFSSLIQYFNAQVCDTVLLQQLLH